MNRLTFTVKCPIDFSKQNMDIEYTQIDQHNTFFHPCQGCNSAHGSKKCECCQAALTVMFIRGYMPQTGEVVIPDFSVLQ